MPTRITAKESAFGKEVRVNGRFVDFVPNIEIKRINDYTHEVKRTNSIFPMTFHVWGGKASGGSSDMWFLDEINEETGEIKWSITFKSAKAAVETIWNM